MCIQYCYSFFMQLLGIVLCISTYMLLSLHVYGYFTVIAPIIKKRLGVAFGLIWIAIGLSLLYNIVFNHFWAMVIKPGNPSDLLENEQLRKEVKNRENRKAAKVSIDDEPAAKKKVVPRKGTAEFYQTDDRYDGLKKDVKKLMKYRVKTMSNLKSFWNKKCKECNEIKPARTNHCSICETCVF